MTTPVNGDTREKVGELRGVLGSFQLTFEQHCIQSQIAKQELQDSMQALENAVINLMERHLDYHEANEHKFGLPKVLSENWPKVIIVSSLAALVMAPWIYPAVNSYREGLLGLIKLLIK